MKHTFTLIVSVLVSAFTTAQTANAVVFSENGDKFTLILNGEKQNETPQANVKIKDLTGEFYQARVDFENPSIPDFTQKNFVVHKGFEVTYVIKSNKKGEYVMRFQSESEIPGSTASKTDAPAGDVQVVDYVIEEETTAPAQKTTVTTTAPSKVTTTTTTTTTTKPSGSGEKVNVNMNVGGVNMGINMNVEGMDSEMEVEETTTVKTTSSSSTTISQQSPAPRQEVVVVEKTTGCTRPMDSASFNSAKSSISSKGFDDTKLSTAKQAIKANCMSTAQIKEVMSLFGFEDSRLDFAKYAYDYCSDKNNYYTVSDVFSFSSSADELNKYLESK